MALETCLSDKLRGSYGFTENKVALYLFAMMGLSFFCSTAMLLIPKSFDKRPVMLVALFVITVTGFLKGPSALLGLPDKSEILLTGLIGFGVVEPVIFNSATSHSIKAL